MIWTRASIRMEWINRHLVCLFCYCAIIKYHVHGSGNLDRFIYGCMIQVIFIMGSRIFAVYYPSYWLVLSFIFVNTSIIYKTIAGKNKRDFLRAREPYTTLIVNNHKNTACTICRFTMTINLNIASKKYSTKLPLFVSEL